MVEYLTENKLESFLFENISNDWIFNKTVKKGIRFRPDFRSENKKMIVEFNGFYHYTSPKVIINDRKKREIFTSMGYIVIEIPYFVQLSTIVIKNLFNLNINYYQKYPHGFIDDNAKLPAEFCYLGINRFLMDLNCFNYISQDIIESLKNRLLEKPKELVIPEMLNYIIQE